MRPLPLAIISMYELPLGSEPVHIIGVACWRGRGSFSTLTTENPILTTGRVPSPHVKERGVKHQHRNIVPIRAWTTRRYMVTTQFRRTAVTTLRELVGTAPLPKNTFFTLSQRIQVVRTHRSDAVNCMNRECPYSSSTTRPRLPDGKHEPPQTVTATRERRCF
ncbi:hypothetical protein BDZ45DRAFT_747097 [Acephala macrosclerotiorum]|nr:hypothetical protein BDZ45DRAFT_747097 [Acephala macrosclerotiorum]